MAFFMTLHGEIVNSCFQTANIAGYLSACFILELTWYKILKQRGYQTHLRSIPLVWSTDAQAEGAWKTFTADSVKETY